MNDEHAAPPTNPLEILRVDPLRINLSTQGLNSKVRPDDIRTKLQASAAFVLDGDWDRGAWRTEPKRIEDLDVYQAMVHRFVEKGEWKDTPFYERVVRTIRGGTPKWRCSTQEQFDQRLRDDIEGLYSNISRNGFQSQAELGTKNPADEIRVGICRDGRFIMFDGRHRLCIARILKIPEVPVVVVVRHQQWVEFKQKIVDYAKTKLKGRVYQQLDHPDLASIPAKHGNERLPILFGTLGDGDRTGQSLLDIGTHWGHMCQQFERRGFNCVGIEANADCAEFARRLGVANECHYSIWHGNLVDHPGGRFDVVLALSIFHHLIKTKERHHGLIRFLESIDTDLMIFEPHDPVRSAEQMQGAYRNYGPEEFAQFVSKHARLPKIEFLGRTEDRYKRPICTLRR